MKAVAKELVLNTGYQEKKAKLNNMKIEMLLSHFKKEYERFLKNDIDHMD